MGRFIDKIPTFGGHRLKGTASKPVCLPYMGLLSFQRYNDSLVEKLSFFRGFTQPVENDTRASNETGWVKFLKKKSDLLNQR